MSARANFSTPFPIAVVSDTMCPWCFIGKGRLERALARLPDIPVAVGWWPFLLDPRIPPGGSDRKLYLRSKFGSADGGEMYLRLKEAGREEGIAFAFDAIEKAPNTVDSHRLIHWAGANNRQSETVERLFQLYFLEGADIGDADVLAGAAGEAGLDAEDVRARLQTEEDRAVVLAMIGQAQQLGISAVPTFILGGRRAVIGAQPADVLVEQIRIAARSFAENA